MVRLPALSNLLSGRWPGPQRVSLEAATIVIVLGLLALRLIVIAVLPITFDEALYWRYSKHLAAGYMDHPYLNPLMIRIGTTLFGDTPFGTRFMSVLLTLPASWAVWQAAMNLFANRQLAARATLFFNLMGVTSFGSMLATSDQIVVVTSAFLLFSLARLQSSGFGPVWILVGVIFGLGMSAKYTTLFFAVSIGTWMVWDTAARRWWTTPWPWLGGLTALLVFSPVLLWNQHHHWASLVYQSGRVGTPSMTLRYVLELLGAIMALATPPIFILACLGLFGRGADPRKLGERRLLTCLIAPLLIYFFWHALHERVQGNWPEPVFPASAVMAAWAAHQTPTISPWARWSRMLALPLALTLIALVYLHLLTGILPLGRRDPIARVTGVGWPAVAKQIDTLRRDCGSAGLLTTDYTLAGWLKFYLPKPTVVEQVNQRMRWINEPAIDPGLLARPVLYVCRKTCPQLSEIQPKFAKSEKLAVVPRLARGQVIDNYSIYKFSDPIRPVFEPLGDIPRAGKKL